ncbi:MAG: hypothetical protein ACW99J_08390 [Candidatus Thorarchaeota archaeon]
MKRTTLPSDSIRTLIFRISSSGIAPELTEKKTTSFLQTLQYNSRTPRLWFPNHEISVDSQTLETTGTRVEPKKKRTEGASIQN